MKRKELKRKEERYKAEGRKDTRSKEEMVQEDVKAGYEKKLKVTDKRKK